ncbi:hypothetical protein P170DRAFT_396820 [Aspergillus steynii IBT 23096]|uniref:HNH nuclease domain-containing protein n=1 Tax=Aspergillus steynii IBT 23096 TaxID=1392250 RepID=A0A2I2GLX6_9EURO|nr:uncharacterized protein P170DRAFT_396820 [Aspergillus steynii IBT 23096]PLB53872.1 hypothetical protein P170DRAFT_396820 [Aspergillus steynii IBT 23096]
MSDSESMPPLYVPKKRKAEELADLRNEKRQLELEAKDAQKKLKPRGSFDAEFWTTATEVESLHLRKTRVVSDISISEFQGKTSDWERTDVARNLFEQIRAQEYRVRKFKAQSEQLSQNSRTRRFCASFMKLFTTSTLGLGAKERAGAGKRDSSEQSCFRAELMLQYKSMHDTQDFAWCPILGEYVEVESVTASHLFSYKHGQATMDAIFGKTSPPELFSAKNGLIMCSKIEKVFDSGAIVIVPDIPERPLRSALQEWIQKETRDYKTKIIDPAGLKMEKDIIAIGGLKWKDLDGRKLQFKGDFRPAARYLYFHYCLQILRRAWRAGPGQHAAFTLQEELGKPVWATPGRYIPRNMLLAFVEELGHRYYDSIIIGATRRRGRPGILMDAAAAQIANKEEDKEDVSDTDSGSED